MSKSFKNLMAQVNAKREHGKASDRAIAKTSGMTLKEFDADETKPDPLEETDKEQSE